VLARRSHVERASVTQAPITVTLALSAHEVLGKRGYMSVLVPSACHSISRGQSSRAVDIHTHAGEVVPPCWRTPSEWERFSFPRSSPENCLELRLERLPQDYPATAEPVSVVRIEVRCAIFPGETSQNATDLSLCDSTRQVSYILNQNTRSVQNMVAPLHMRVSRSKT